MIFIQNLILIYKKDVRYAAYAQQRNAFRFLPVSVMPEHNEEIFFHRVLAGQTKEHAIQILHETANCYSDELFYTGRFQNTTPTGIERTAVRKLENQYQILYTSRKERGFYHPVFTLAKHQYGRIIWNERTVHHYTSQWDYRIHILNFINADKSAFRPKLFFRKEPHFLFEDLSHLKYSGNH